MLENSSTQLGIHRTFRDTIEEISWWPPHRKNDASAPVARPWLLVRSLQEQETHSDTEVGVRL